MVLGELRRRRSRGTPASRVSGVGGSRAGGGAVRGLRRSNGGPEVAQSRSRGGAVEDPRRRTRGSRRFFTGRESAETRRGREGERRRGTRVGKSRGSWMAIAGNNFKLQGVLLFIQVGFSRESAGILLLVASSFLRQLLARIRIWCFENRGVWYGSTRID